MSATLIIYHDDGDTQLSNTDNTLFLTNKVSVATALSSTAYNGAYACLQTNSAYLTTKRVGNTPRVDNYSANSFYYYMSYEPSEVLINENFGLELFNEAGERTYHSGYRPMKILDIVTGKTSTSNGMLVNKNYNKPIAVLVGHVPTLNKAIRVIATATGIFQVHMETGDTFGVSTRDLTYSENLHRGKPNPYQFIIIDVTGY